MFVVYKTSTGFRPRRASSHNVFRRRIVFAAIEMQSSWVNVRYRTKDGFGKPKRKALPVWETWSARAVSVGLREDRGSGQWSSVVVEPAKEAPYTPCFVAAPRDRQKNSRPNPLPFRHDVVLNIFTSSAAKKISWEFREGRRRQEERNYLKKYEC